MQTCSGSLQIGRVGVAWSMAKTSPSSAADGAYHFHDLLPGCYYLVADPPVNRKGPARNATGHAVGEVPVRYPAPTSQRPNPFFTLHEGEQDHLNWLS